MTAGTLKSEVGYGFRSVGFLLVFLAAIFLVRCISIPVALYYFQTDRSYVAKADARKSADEVWTVVVRLAEEEEAEGRIEILERDDTERLVKSTDGVQTAELKVIPLGKRKSRVTIMADVPKGEEEEREKEKELAIRTMNRLCDKAKAGCTLIEE